MQNQNKQINRNIFSFVMIYFSSILLFSVVSYADFTRNNSTEIVTDNNANLQWQDNIDGSTLTKTWTEAIGYCENELTLGGYNDWRLPNIRELKSISDTSTFFPAIKSEFTNQAYMSYWSSTSVSGSSDSAWKASSVDGSTGYGSKVIEFAIRCVRSGQ